MKIRILLVLMCVCNLISAQEFDEYPIQNFPKTFLEINAPKDTVMNYMKAFYEESLVEADESLGKLFYHFPDSQFFELKEDVLEYKNKGMTFHNVYDTYSLKGSEWEILVKEISKEKTEMSFEMTKALVDKEYFNAVETWEKYYKGKEKEFVSNEVLEDLISHYFQIMLATSPLLSIDLDGMTTYQNAYYGYTIDLKPKTKFNEKLILNKEVPTTETAKIPNAILIYDRNNSKLVLFDVKNKSIKWEKKLPNIDDQNKNEFTLYQNTIYVATGSGYVLAMDANSGEIYWQNQPMGDEKLKGGLTNFFFGQKTPVSDDKVFVNQDGLVYVLDRFTGKAIWAQQIGGYGHYNYSFDKEYLYKSGISEMLQIQKSDGKIMKILNSIEANTFYSDNLLENEILYFAGYAYDVSKDELVWDNKNAGGDILPQIKTTEYLFLSNESNAKVAAVEKNSGKLKWTWNVEPKKDFSATIISETDAGNEILVLAKYKNYSTNTENFTAFFIDKKDGQTKFSIEIPGKVISNSFSHEGNLYVLTEKSLVQFDRKTKKLTQIPFDFSGFSKPEMYYLNNVESVK